KKREMMEKMCKLIGLIGASRVAVERVIELIKSSIPGLGSTWSKREGLRRALIQLLAVFVGAVMAWQMPSQLGAATGSQPKWQVDILFGLLASGGAGGWDTTPRNVSSPKDDKKHN